MKILLEYKENRYEADLSQPLDISIPLPKNGDGVNCFYAPPFEFSPYTAGDWVGAVAKGAPVNFMNVRINPHGNGTHTECVGHITSDIYAINDALKQFHFMAKVVSIYPQVLENGDRVILRAQVEEAFAAGDAQALVIRTQPNDATKLSRQYSYSNPPYIDAAAMAYILEAGVEHLLLDLPSVDREEDEGKLAAHHIFWEHPKATNYTRTITEMIYVANEIKDGIYLLNIQIPSFSLDAAPSKPVLYGLNAKK